ncbi:MAG: hypothetical protein A2Y77_06150 [Planctomycetes bacterium RBG_13_62_9]|nr:MAG: hypothetical protein A2Y77_06150 [Planctomycetes bacterium RBG_13_62_9]
MTLKQPFIRKKILIVMGVTIFAAIVCLTVVAFLPSPKGSLLTDPLRSFLTGLGVLGVAYPLCVTGGAMKRRWESSPYFEGTFIAAVISLFGLVCVAVGLVCIGFGAYGLIVRLSDLK